MRFFLKTIPFFLIALLAYYLWSKTNEHNLSNTVTEVSHQTIIEKIEKIGKLELAKMNVRDVMEYNQSKKILGINFNSKALLIIGGEAVACIDFEKIQPESVLAKGDLLEITLPSPTLCHVKVLHKNSKVVKLEGTAFITEEAKLVDEAYKEAEDYLTKIVEQTDLKDRAKQNAVQLLTPLFEQISGKKVSILFQEKYDVSLKEK